MKNLGVLESFHIIIPISEATRAVGYFSVVCHFPESTTHLYRGERKKPTCIKKKKREE